MQVRPSLRKKLVSQGRGRSQQQNVNNLFCILQNLSPYSSLTTLKEPIPKAFVKQDAREHFFFFLIYIYIHKTLALYTHNLKPTCAWYQAYPRRLELVVELFKESFSSKLDAKLIPH